MGTHSHVQHINRLLRMDEIYRAFWGVCAWHAVEKHLTCPVQSVAMPVGYLLWTEIFTAKLSQLSVG